MVPKLNDWFKLIEPAKFIKVYKIADLHVQKWTTDMLCNKQLIILDKKPQRYTIRD